MQRTKSNRREPKRGWELRWKGNSRELKRKGGWRKSDGRELKHREERDSFQEMVFQ